MANLKTTALGETTTPVGSDLLYMIDATTSRKITFANALKLAGTANIPLTPSSSETPASNGDLVVEATNNTTLTFRLKGSDGTVRSGTITLS